MLNRIGYKIFAGLYAVYSLTLLVYELFVINVLHHEAGVFIIIFTSVNLLVDGLALLVCPKLCKIDSSKSSSLSFFSLLLTLMTFVTVVFARNIISPNYFVFALLSVFLIYLLFSIPIWFYYFKHHK